MSTLSEEIKSTYLKLDGLLEHVPINLVNEKKIVFAKSLVSIADLIAYQIGWGKLLLQWYQSGIKNQTIQMPGEGFNKWDYKGLAKHFFQIHHYKNFSAQRQVFQQIVQEITAFVEYESQTGSLDKVGVWSWCTLPSGKKWPLSKWVTVNTKSPYKRAKLLIEKSLTSQSKYPNSNKFEH